MTQNASKCNLLVSWYKDGLMFAKVRDALLWEEISVKLIGIIIDSSLTFDDHVKQYAKSPLKNSPGISRMSNYMSDDKKRS